MGERASVHWPSRHLVRASYYRVVFIPDWLERQYARPGMEARAGARGFPVRISVASGCGRVPVDVQVEVAERMLSQLVA
jgi:hypothetical protein